MFLTLSGLAFWYIKIEAVKFTVASHIKGRGVELSVSAGFRHGNQVAESFNSNIKLQVAIIILEKIQNLKEKKEFLGKLTSQQKKLNAKAKARNKEVRNFLFETAWFGNPGKDCIKEAIEKINQAPHSTYKKFSRLQVDFYVNKKADSCIDFKSSKKFTPEAAAIIATQYSTLDKTDKEVQIIKKQPPELQQKLLKQLGVFEPKTSYEIEEFGIKALLMAGFTLTKNATDVIIEQNLTLLQEQAKMKEHIKSITDELEIERHEKLAKQQRIERYARRKRLEEKQGVELVHYKRCRELIGEEETYVQARQRLAVTLLFITGARISEVLAMEKERLLDLFTKQRPFIAFNRLKRGKTNQKAFLTPEGARVAKERARDYEIVLRHSKENNAYIFSQKNEEDNSLSRPYFTTSINKLLSRVGKEFNRKLSSHSFRKGYITRLWQKAEDIEFVRQIIGHACIATTQRYIEPLSDTAKQEKMAPLEEN